MAEDRRDLTAVSLVTAFRRQPRHRLRTTDRVLDKSGRNQTDAAGQRFAVGPVWGSDKMHSKFGSATQWHRLTRRAGIAANYPGQVVRRDNLGPPRTLIEPSSLDFGALG